MKLKFTKPPAGRVAPGPTGPEPTPDRPPAPERVKFVELVAGERVYWSVAEVDADAVPGARRARCLVFSHARSVRRVWDYPADWRTLDDAALAALSWGR